MADPFVAIKWLVGLRLMPLGGIGRRFTGSAQLRLTSRRRTSNRYGQRPFRLTADMRPRDRDMGGPRYWSGGGSYA